MSQCETIVRDKVYPAYRQYLSYMQRILPLSSNDAGVWKLPNGDAYYQQQLRFFTTTNMTASNIHELGISETARIQSEILTILESEGYPANEGFSKAIFALADDPKHYYPDSDEGHAQIISDYKTIIREITGRIGEVVRNPVIEDIDFQRIPLFKEKDSAGAYYERPSMDGSRPGVFFANLHDIKATPKYGMKTLAYHEAVPGHHFQITTANQLKGLPLFRSFVPSIAYLEGWALYSERLAYEMGLIKDPLVNVGLTSRTFSCCEAGCRYWNSLQTLDAGASHRLHVSKYRHGKV